MLTRGLSHRESWLRFGGILQCLFGVLCMAARGADGSRYRNNCKRGKNWFHGRVVIIFSFNTNDSGMLIFRLTVAAILVATISLPAVAEEQIEFVLPSGNVGCIYTPKGGVAHYQPVDGGPELSCDRVEPRYVRIVLGPKGKAVLIKNVGDASCCSAEPVLAYGEIWKAGPFTCQASTKGLECKRGRNGFVMSRSRLKVF